MEDREVETTDGIQVDDIVFDGGKSERSYGYF